MMYSVRFCSAVHIFSLFSELYRTCPDLDSIKVNQTDHTRKGTHMIPRFFKDLSFNNRSIKTQLIMWVLLIPAVSSAEVVSQAEHGFHIKSTINAPVSAVDAYRQFLQVSEWWIEDHTWFGSAENLILNPVAGGCFCEINGDQQVQHMTVSYVNPGKALRMTGGLGPLQQMGVSGTLSYQFVGISEHESLVVQEYRVSGFYPEGLDSLASIVDSVQSAQLNSLQARLSETP